MKQTLYLGLELPPHLQTKNMVHCPFIRIVAKPATDPDISLAFKNFIAYTHLIFTSKNAVSIFFNLLDHYSISRKEVTGKIILSVGQRTAQKIKENGAHVNFIATEETAEGILDILISLNLKHAHLFLPHSAIARPTLSHWLTKKKITHTVSQIYNTIANLPSPLPDLTNFDEVIFTSPSTVNAFIKGYGTLPEGIKLTCIGPVTERKLLFFKND